MARYVIFIMLLAGFATPIFGQQTVFRKKLFFGVEYNNEEIVDSSNYVFSLAKLYELKDDSLLLKKQIIRPNREESKFDKIYYWSSIPVIPNNNTLLNTTKRACPTITA